jgi:hypothetical protein
VVTTPSRGRPQAPTSSAFLQSLTQQILAWSPQWPGSSHGLLVPPAQVSIEGPLSGKVPRLPTFRLQGLASLLTVSSLRSLVSFVAHSPRSWDFPLRSYRSRQVRWCFHPRLPTCRLLLRLMQLPKVLHGNASRGSWAFSRRERSDASCLSQPSEQLPWGFSFLGCCHRLVLNPFGLSSLALSL